MAPPHLTLVANPALKDSVITLIPWQAYPEEDCDPTIPLYSWHLLIHKDSLYLSWYEYCRILYIISNF